jgi:energy-coupling factor transport system ATP-binding protein
LEAYRIENLTFFYPTRKKAALRNISLKINSGEFITLCGSSGCGKTTLLRHLKPAVALHGEKSGVIFFNGVPIEDVSARDAAAKIGFVFQSPENQIVTDKVWHELAFGLESLGASTSEIRLRVAETANFFGIQEWFHKSVTELSGGQKQILALASVMVMSPSVLIFDEPTAQLDPIAAGEFLSMVAKINRELGVTVILSEHRLEDAFPLSSRVIAMDDGQIVSHLKNSAMPTPMRVWTACGKKGDCPMTVRDGAEWLATQEIKKFSQEILTEETNKANSMRDCLAATDKTDLEVTRYTPAIILKDIFFRYEKNLPDAIKGLSFTANYGEITAILGGNGSGKTTALSIMCGLCKPYRGKIIAEQKVFALPQNPQALFSAKTVREDLFEISKKIGGVVKLCCLEELLDFHPYDLSGGEQQRAALAKVLLLQPKILLLDEPTKGLDAEYKQIFAAILKKLTNAGAAVVLVSHDVEFCAEYADRCALLFDGAIATENISRKFFSRNNFYTTAANRMARKILPEAITASDIILALGGEVPPALEITDIDVKYEMRDDIPPPPKPPKFSLPRKFFSAFFVLWLLAAIAFTMANAENFFAFISGGVNAIAVATEGAAIYVAIMLALAIGVTGISFSFSWKREEKPPRKQKLSKRTIAAAIIILLTIPLTIFLGANIFDDRKFYFVSTLVLLQTMLPFALIFEGRKPQARELIIIAVLCAIAVAGRGAFFMLPQFKPVIAIVIIAGVAFGGEAGFFVGATTAFVSNMFFGQGPWTPWQMFAFGIIGFLAGVLFKKGLLRRTRISLCVFGGIATFFIFGGIMNPAGVLMWQPNPTPEMFFMYYLMGIPMDLIHAAATITFLVIISQPMLEKLDRVKTKYGLVE